MIRFVRIVWVFLFLFLAAGLPGHNVRAQVALDVTPIEGVDLTQAPLRILETWHTGILRVIVSGTGDPKDWSVTLDYGAAGSLELDGIALTSRSISRNSRGMTIDLPIPAASQVTARSTQNAISIKAISVIYQSTLKSQQMIDKSNVISINAAASENEKKYAPAYGRLDLLAQNGALLGLCTAFRVAKGYWLTAAHCAYRDDRHANDPVISWHRIQPDHYAGQVEGAKLFKARVVASGLKMALPSPEALMQSGDMDYALLEVPGDAGGPAFPLSVSAAATAETKLELLHHWKGEFAPPAGKAASVGAACKVYERIVRNDPSDSESCPNGIQHGCSSQGGASGGALVNASSFTLIGLHYGAGRPSKYNCGVPAAAIARDLCARNSEIAKGVVTCP